VTQIYYWEVNWWAAAVSDNRSHRQPSGPSPMTSSYKASAVKIYYATSSRMRFENKNILFYLCEKRSSLLQRWRCRWKFRSHWIGSRFWIKIVPGKFEQSLHSFVASKRLQRGWSRIQMCAIT
jgi:hypothetical protein